MYHGCVWFEYGNMWFFVNIFIYGWIYSYMTIDEYDNRWIIYQYDNISIDENRWK